MSTNWLPINFCHGLFIVSIREDMMDAGVFNLAGHLCIDALVFFNQNFTGIGVCHIFCCDTIHDPVEESQFFIVFISAYFGKVISFRVKK